MVGMFFSLGTVLFCTGLVLGDKEYSQHGAHSPLSDKQHHHDGEHNIHYDHEAILGSRKVEEEFDELEPEEAKRRLAILVKKMDKNGDGSICEKELKGWIRMSFKMLDDEEAQDAMQEQDADNDNRVTWQEFLKKQYGYDLEDVEELRSDSDENEEFLVMVDEDKLKFSTADLNKDDYLDSTEYAAFHHPYEYEHMHDIELGRVMKTTDKDKDGYITWQEFIGERTPDKEMQIYEEEHFKGYDKNGDGRLDREEIKGWVLPDNEEIVEEEVEHLVSMADEDKDGVLSEQEIIDQHDVFVGSQATDFGRHLHIVKDEL